MAKDTSKPEPTTKQKVLAGVTLGLVAIVVIAIATSIFGGSDEEGGDSGQAAAPAFSVVSDETAGVTRNLVIEVDTTENLRGVFDAVLDQYGDADAAYFVTINCSTGAESTGLGDNRLANGRAAVGSPGEAGTGLADGEVDFEEVAGRTCPA